MSTPYEDLPDYQFHNREVRGNHPSRFDPIITPRFTLDIHSKIMTMGSCFAQNLSKWLLHHNFNLLLKEHDRQAGGLFSANYGNVYTVQQATQLFNRAFKKWQPNDELYVNENGAYFDPLRPSAIDNGFDTREATLTDRKNHEHHVKTLFLEADVFVFTLGLTEAWRRKNDGAILPIAPGVVAGKYDKNKYDFNNFSFDAVRKDLLQFCRDIHKVNPKCKILLTVSPVPLAATFENKHVSVASMASKAILRAAVEDALNAFEFVDYFPSFEVFFTPGIGNAYFEYDARHVLPEGVAHAMRLFAKHYTLTQPSTRDNKAILDYSNFVLEKYDNVVCDEGKIG